MMDRILDMFAGPHLRVIEECPVCGEVGARVKIQESEYVESHYRWSHKTGHGQQRICMAPTLKGEIHTMSLDIEVKF